MNNFENKISVKGKYWQIADSNSHYIKSATQKFGISDLLANLLSQKNIPLDEVEKFLDPKIRDYLPDPFSLKDMDKAVERIIYAIKNHENIAIYGDYDVDGATATAIFTKFLRELGIKTTFYIPDRIKEGYGVNTEALKYLKDGGTDLVITVDCGVLSFEPIDEAKKFGLDVIVIDHHLSNEVLPSAVAIINPNRFDESGKLSNLCAAGVSFLTCVAINSELKKQAYYSNTNSPKEPKLLDFLDLVALGTICDVMTLTGINRAYVNQGLKILAKRQNAGLSALCDISGLKDKPDVYSLGFLIGPRINAAGRISDCSLGAKILTETHYTTAQELAETLNNLNKERQEIEKIIYEEALEQAIKISKDKPFITLFSNKWHPGVIGIVAGKIKEILDKPTAVISVVNGIGKASARSVSGVDVGSAVINAQSSGLILFGGGHKAAAGFTVEEDKISELDKFFCEFVEKDYSKYSENKTQSVNLALRVSSLTPKLADEISKLSPFGNGNSEPIIAIDNAKIVSIKTYADKHLGFYISDADMAKINSVSVKAICFNAINTPLGNAIQDNYMKNVSLLGKLRKNTFNNKENIDFHVEDIITY